MMQNEMTRACLLAHCAAYPKLQPKDLFKYLFQSAFGCEHMVSSEERAIAYIQKEYASLTLSDTPTVEPLDGAYSRVNLSCLREGLSPQTLGRLFCCSARIEPNAKAALEEKLHIARELADEGLLPFSAEEFDRFWSEWQREGCFAIHHSERFRAEYHPAYRVIANAYIPFLPLLTKIDLARANQEKGITTDCAYTDGKTLAKLLADMYGDSVTLERKDGIYTITLL